MNKILLVEDNESLALSLGIALKAAGFEALVAEDGEKALKTAVEERPALILLDLFLPVMDGFKVLEHLKKDGRTSGIPVAVFSVLSQDSDKVEAKRLGAKAYFVKSEMSVQQVVDEVRKLLA